MPNFPLQGLHGSPNGHLLLTQLMWGGSVVTFSPAPTFCACWLRLGATPTHNERMRYSLSYVIKWSVQLIEIDFIYRRDEAMHYWEWITENELILFYASSLREWSSAILPARFEQILWSTCQEHILEAYKLMLWVQNLRAKSNCGITNIVVWWYSKRNLPSVVIGIRT